MSQRVIEAADLFCGAGGTSTGLLAACADLGYEVKLTAINHWEVAIATHASNHKSVAHHCGAIKSISPLAVVPARRLKLLVASPECTHHSNARGGKPMDDQKRADAWELLRWIEELYIETLIIENVKEFRDWGPLGANGRPLKSERGQFFRRFLNTLETIYRVEYRILNAANYGDATTRERLFIVARRPKHKQIVWPAPSHAAVPVKTTGGRTLPKWRSAREIIDWSLPGESIFNSTKYRKRPLKPNTLARIAAGLMKYSGLAPFILPNEGFYRGNAPRDVEQPIPTVTSRGAGAIVAPFIIGAGGPQGASLPRDVERPLGTILTDDHKALVEPFIVNVKGAQRGDRSVDAPTYAQCGGNHQALAQPFLINMKGASVGRGIDSPTPTQTAHAGHLGLCEPYIVPVNHGQGDKRTHPLDKPMPTITSVDAWALIEPFLIQFFGERKGQTPRTRDVEHPLWTVTGQGRMGLIQPYLVKYYLGSDAASVDEPLPTVTANYEHLALAEPFLVHYHGSHAGRADGDKRTRSLNEPLKTLDTSNRVGLAHPYLINFYGTGGPRGVDDPLDTITAKDKFGLCVPQLGGVIDILFRMLQPHELAAAHSFPRTYVFSGTREQKVKQIGNSVPVALARALVRSLLQDDKPKQRKRRAA